MKKQNNIHLTFYGGVENVTGANFLLEIEDKKILVDCGLLQGVEGADKINKKDFEYNPKEIDVLIVTHAHMDHIGRIPKLVRDGFEGDIYSTPTTKQLAKISFSDAVRFNDPTDPLYDSSDVARAMSIWKEIDYHKKEEILPEISLHLKDAGHIMGSAMAEIAVSGKKIVFTGDLGNSPDVLLRDTEKVTDADYLIMESVYGYRNHESKEVRDKKFENTIRKTLERGGTVVIPTFSLERSQVILYMLNELIESKKLPSVPVFLDSPLAIKMTRVFEEVKKNYNEIIKQDILSGDDIFDFPKLKLTKDVSDSKEIANVKGPKIVIAGSGMSTGGRIVYHEARYLPDPKNTLLLVGYQVVGTLGRELQEGSKEVLINDQLVPVKAEVKMIEGFSSHKDMDNLIEFVSNTKDSLKKVFVVMGEPKTSLFLAQRLKDYLGVKALCPERGKRYDLS